MGAAQSERVQRTGRPGVGGYSRRGADETDQGER